jgi:hypothetical protein
MTSPGGRRQMARKATPPVDRTRRLRMWTVAMVVLLGLIVVVVIVMLGALGGPRPSPSTVAFGSRSPALTTSAAASPTVSPLASPTATLSSSATPSTPGATPTVTAEPTKLQKAPSREVVFTLLGIDNPVAPEATERRITFKVDGRGDIKATISDISAGLVQMCLSPGDGSIPPAPTDCVVTPDSEISRSATTAGPWTVILAGAMAGRSPSITLVLHFPATAGQLQLSNFRFQGQDSPNYTGYDMKVTALADGQLAVTASWDDGLGGNYPYTLTLLDLSVDFEEPVVVEGISHLAAAQRDVVKDHTYEITMVNLQEEIIPAVFLLSTITWP